MNRNISTKVRRRTLIRALARAGVWQDPIIQEAFLLMDKHHHEQRRDLGGFVINRHLLPATLAVLQEFQGSHEELVLALAVTLLHDATEDTTLTAEVIANRCGSRVAAAVQTLDRNGTPDATYFGFIANDPFLSFLKCQDRFNNLVGMEHLYDKVRILRFCEETQIHILPMATRHCPFMLPRLQRQLDKLRMALS